MVKNFLYPMGFIYEKNYGIYFRINSFKQFCVFDVISR